MKKTITTMTTLALLLASVPAYAQLGVDVTSATEATAQVDSVVNSNTNVEANVDADVEATSNNEAQVDSSNREVLETTVANTIDAAVDTNTQVGVEAQTGVRTETTSSNNTKTKTEASSQATIRIGGDLVPVNSNNSVTSASQVDNNEELAVFAQTTANNDTQINTIESSENEVKVKYNETVYLFGMIKMNMNRTAKVMFNVNADAKVQVSKPWWAFMVSGDVVTNADIESDIEENMSASTKTTTQTSARMQAVVMAAIQASLKTNLSVEAKNFI